MSWSKDALKKLTDWSKLEEDCMVKPAVCHNCGRLIDKEYLLATRLMMPQSSVVGSDVCYLCDYREVREMKLALIDVAKRMGRLVEDYLDAVGHWATLECESCGGKFKVDVTREGVITCPYCGELVED